MKNPYVGPRAFKYGETLYGREAEIPELLDLLISERIVLLHSPSGAGKTSLIQAGLIPELKNNRFFVWPVLRVDLSTPKEWSSGQSCNRYVASVLQSLHDALDEASRAILPQLAHLSLCEIFSKIRIPNGEDLEFDVLIFDQFEEVFTIDPTDVDAKRDFFSQVGELLRERNHWALFAMRDEYIASLKPYLRTVPTHLSTQFHLNLLNQEAARRAIQFPAKQLAVEFEGDAAQLLVDDLRQVQVQTSDGSTQWLPGQYVEPVQLQVVCRRIWDKRSDEKRISKSDIGEFENVNLALSSYYADSVTKVSGKTGVNERQIRDWIESALITKEGIRSRILKEPDVSKGLENKVIGALVDVHLIRVEESQYRTWFELAHDRLVEPVIQDNKSWRERNLVRWQVQAILWSQQGMPKSLLLLAEELKEAEEWAILNESELEPIEHRYLDESRSHQNILRKEGRQKKTIVFSSAIILVLGVLILGYIYNFKRSVLPWGYIRDAEMGSAYLMRNAQATIGRSTQYKNTVNFSDRNHYISRMHFILTKDGKAFDMRSLNGTTVNAEYLPYGAGIDISDGDLVVLAGMAVMQIHWLDYPFYQFWESKISNVSERTGWGLFIDGTNRQVIPLSEQRYFVHLDKNGKALISTDQPSQALLRIEHDPEYIVRVWDEKDDNILQYQFKADDYSYPQYEIPEVYWFSDEVFRWPDRYQNSHQQRMSPINGVFRYEKANLKFQIIPLGFRSTDS